MKAIEPIVARLKELFPDAVLEIIANEAVADQPSLRVSRQHLRDVALALRDGEGWKFDMASNVTGTDWLPRVEKQKVEVTRVVDGEEKLFQDTIEIQHPGYLEAVYHLYSVALRHGPMILRARTEDRGEKVQLPSLTPVWRSCELQEREIYDLYGIQFEGHPDMRRLLMWEDFVDHPMRKDYVDPDDFEYEPTPHDEVLKRAEAHRAAHPEGGAR
ncbi:MAG: NADH-quinone oxidoreductase subunit C [Limisphaerales bacterium]|jgi:NADH-quinone oxidoreductase subunit C